MVSKYSVTFTTVTCDYGPLHYDDLQRMWVRLRCKSYLALCGVDDDDLTDAVEQEGWAMYGDRWMCDVCYIERGLTGGDDFPVVEGEYEGR